MKVVIVGLGIQGRKRLAVAGADAVGTVDPTVAGADYGRIEDVPLDTYDAALVCTPDDAKIELLTYLLTRGKHVLVEKPLLAASSGELRRLDDLARANRAVCYTAYNHRFEPHIVRLKAAIDSGALGNVYLGRFFYGNGTAADVRRSPWRDRGLGVVPDLGSHLLDMSLFLFGTTPPFRAWAIDSFENAAPDHFMLATSGPPAVQLEATLLSWRNTFTADVYGDRGSAHIDCLCKWGPSRFTLRTRVLPSGKPPEESTTLECADPTWAIEYEHFRGLCRTGGTNLANDIWINDALNSVASSLTAKSH